MMEASNQEDAIKEFRKKGHLSHSYSPAGLITQPPRLAVIEEGENRTDSRVDLPNTTYHAFNSIINNSPCKATKAPVRHRRTQSHCPPVVPLSCANNTKPKIIHR